jgi:uncharacterized protein (DUF427 family)
MSSTIKTITFIVAFIIGTVSAYIFVKHRLHPASNTVQTQLLPQIAINQTSTPAPTPTPDPEPNLDSPIRRVDFRNFAYPSFWTRGRIEVRNGTLETETEHCMTEYSVQSVSYLDFTGDGKDEALIQMTDFTACGSSGVSHYYYIYAMRSNRLRLLWRFSTGSEGICGLKDFRVEDRDLVFELYGNCRIRGARYTWIDRNMRGECCPENYSRVRVAWNGRRFRERTADIFPFPYTSIGEYEAVRVRQ